MTAIAEQSTADSTRQPTGYVIGVDIGGTFTDCVVYAPDGTMTGAKAPTTPENRAQGFFDSIEVAAEKLDLPLRELLERSERVVHGTTAGTNAIVARDGAVTGLITTAGHGDIMFLMGGGGRTSGLAADQALHVPSTDKPEPLVPKRLIATVPERIDVDGDVVVQLDEDAAREAIRHLVQDEGAESLAISLMWSVQNPRHEQRIRELAAEVAPEVFVSCGSDLVNQVGEYERTTTAVMNAYIGPLMVRYIDSIEAGAAERGFPHRVLFAQCAGGAITGDEAKVAPIRTVQSGPVAGIVSSQMLARQIGTENVLLADMGGTTFDVSVIRHGSGLRRNVSTFQRYELALPMLDVESVGAGGGSIAWVDSSGRLNVGPRSAGAVPGPACYGNGGTEATVTDADVVLGVIDPDRFLSGRMEIKPELAEEAIGRLAERLELGLLETAAGINRIVDAKMADLVRRMSVLRGLDPRRFHLYAFGGGGPVHSPEVARQAGIAHVVVPLPAIAAMWSALGAAVADVTHVYQQPRSFALPVRAEQIEGIFGALESRAGRDRPGAGAGGAADLGGPVAADQVLDAGARRRRADAGGDLAGRRGRDRRPVRRDLRRAVRPGRRLPGGRGRDHQPARAVPRGDRQAGAAPARSVHRGRRGADQPAGLLGRDRQHRGHPGGAADRGRRGRRPAAGAGAGRAAGHRGRDPARDVRLLRRVRQPARRHRPRREGLIR